MAPIMIRSETHAWEEVKRRCTRAQRRGASVEELRALFIECDAIADLMLEQLVEGIHKNPFQESDESRGRRMKSHRYVVVSVDRKGKVTPGLEHGSSVNRMTAVGIGADLLNHHGGAYGVLDRNTGQLVWSAKYP